MGVLSRKHRKNRDERWRALRDDRLARHRKDHRPQVHPTPRHRWVPTRAGGLQLKWYANIQHFKAFWTAFLKRHFAKATGQGA